MLIELLAGITAVAVMVWVLIDAFTAKNVSKGWTLLGAIVVLVVASVFKVVRGRVRDAARARHESPTDLLGCAHVMLKSLCHNQSGQMRLTIHRIVQGHNKDTEKEYFEQVIPYVGGTGGDPGRKWPTSVGIVGRVAREGDPLWVLRQGEDRAAFTKELVRDWGYSKSAAKGLTDDRKGWIAVPIYDDFSEKNVIGVVYADSSEPSDISENTCKLMAELCEAVASFIRTRYK